MRDTSTALAAWRGRVAVTVSRRRLHLALLIAVAVPLLFSAQGIGLLDPDEGLYADVAQSMVRTGDWIVPRFNGLPYLEKPPLYFWLTALALAVQPGSELAVRVWSALSAFGTVLLTWRMGRRLYGADAGLAAGLVLATTVGFSLYVRKASTDFVFVFCLTLALYGFLRDVRQARAGNRRFLLFYAGSALALLSKGLIGLAFPVLIVASTFVWVRGLEWKELNLARGAVVFAAIALPWHALVAWRESGLLAFYVVDNQILRFLNLRAFLEDDVPVGTIGFLAVTFIWFFPWSVFVLARSSRPSTPAGPWRALMVVWVLVVLGFFAASRSKLEYYALPAFPALAVMVGAGWVSARGTGRWLLAGVAGCVAVGIAAIVLSERLTPDGTLAALAGLNVYYRILREQGQPFPFASVKPFASLLQSLGIVLVTGWTLAGIAWWRGRRRMAFAAVGTSAVAIAVLIVKLLYVVEPHHSAELVSAAIVAAAGPGDVVAVEGSLEYSAALPFYTGRRIVVVNGERGDLDIASRRPEARGWFLDTNGLVQRWQEHSRIFLVTQRPRAQSVVAAIPADSVRLLGRYGSRWLYSNREN